MPYSTSASSSLPTADETAGALQVILRRAHLDAFEPDARVAVVGLVAERLGVFDDRPVVVLAVFGVVSEVRGRGRGAADRASGQGDRSGAER